LVPNLPWALIKLKQKSPGRITKYKIPTIKAQKSGPFQIYSIPKTPFLAKIKDTENYISKFPNKALAWPSRMRNSPFDLKERTHATTYNTYNLTP
jgi:hypothetical protein